MTRRRMTPIRRAGVRPSKNGKRWTAYCNVSGRQRYLGTFDTREDAECAATTFAATLPPVKSVVQWLRDHADHSGEECLLWPFGSSPSYASVKRPLGGYTKAHRMMCEFAHGEPPRPTDVAKHSCDNKQCVNPQHLSWGSHAENVAEAAARGRLLIGERAPRAVLSEEDVRLARMMRATGATYQDLENAFGVSKGSMWHAVTGTQWRHVK